VARRVIFGNSSSGKSTLAQRLAGAKALAHLDLDTLAWLPTTPPSRRPIAESVQRIDAFTHAHADWVIEGCYGDLLTTLLPRCTEVIFLNPGIDACIANAKARPWEPHKYSSREAQDENLAMLLAWIGDYETRRDTCSLHAHRALFDAFDGPKRELRSRPPSA
jgi:adenylate kinase family enzyme